MLDDAEGLRRAVERMGVEPFCTSPREIQFKRLSVSAILPTRAYHGDAGFDLFALHSTAIRWQQATDVPTGVCVAIPEGCYGRIVGRSSAIRKRGVLVQEGVIDAGFRGELFACALGLKATVLIEAGQSIAQLIVSPLADLTVVEVEELPESERGEKGFGSSGN